MCKSYQQCLRLNRGFNRSIGEIVTVCSREDCKSDERISDWNPDNLSVVCDSKCNR